MLISRLFMCFVLGASAGTAQHGVTECKGLVPYTALDIRHCAGSKKGQATAAIMGRNPAQVQCIKLLAPSLIFHLGRRTCVIR